MDTPSSGSYTPPTGPPSDPPPAAGPSGELIHPSNPPKDPVIILVLNILLLCVGYFIAGQWQKGIASLVAAIVIAVPTCGMGVPLINIFTGIDGYMQAQQLKAGHPVGHWTFFNDHR